MSSSSRNYIFVQSFKKIEITMRQVTPEIRLVTRENPTRGKTQQYFPYRIHSKREMSKPRPISNCHQGTKSNPPSSHLQKSKSTLEKSPPVWSNLENFGLATRAEIWLKESTCASYSRVKISVNKGIFFLSLLVFSLL